MGTWGSGPFDGDAAADFLDEAGASPSRAITSALRRIVKAAPGEHLDVDDGGAAWAACELLALAFGHGDGAAHGDDVLAIVAHLAPKEDARLLALAALPRLADRATSELAGLWHDGDEGPAFDASLARLRARLEAAAQGPREVRRPKRGDVLGLPAAPPSPEMIVVQVLGPREVAVFAGSHADEAAALQAVRSGTARRVPASANRLLGRGRLLGNGPLRKDLRGKKLYAAESGAIDGYLLATASAGDMQLVSYEEARDRDLLRPLDEAALRAVALGAAPSERVRTPEAREAELRATHAAQWAQRREVTTPGPFGDLEVLERLVQWIEEYGVENAVRRLHDEATGASGYGRPAEDSERQSYAFVGLVALWHGTWPRDTWPAVLAVHLPAVPGKKLLGQALGAARILVDGVITRDAELRLIWEGAADGGAGLREAVAALREALS